MPLLISRKLTLPVLVSLALGFFLAAPSPAAAQKFLPKTIQFKGASDYSDQELLAASGLKKGAVLTADEIKAAFQRLMDTGVFENIVYKFDGQDLVYTFNLATLYSVRLENLPLTPGADLDAKLHRRFPLYHGKVPNEGGLLDNVRQALEEMLAAQGIKATVSTTQGGGAAAFKVAAISFSIAAPPVLVGDIHLDPSSPPLDPKANEILAHQTGSPYDIVGSPSQLTTYLGNFYHDQGYLEAAINATPQGAPVITPEAVRIPFLLSVTPGPLYKLTSIQLAPDVLVSQADFDHQSHLHPGDIADGQHVTANWQYVSRQYHNKGYMKAAVHPVPTFDRVQGTVSFAVTVEPGPVYNMGALRIDNVSDALRTQMLAAWKMPAGAVFNEGAILGFFATHGVNPALERVFSTVNYKYNLALNDDAHTVDVVLRLEKRP
ncbi:MAG: POTRA domain-containing protein [Terracidiphilus sp.]